MSEAWLSRDVFIDPVNDTDYALKSAISQKNYGMVKRLLEGGANPNTKGRWGCNATYLACQSTLEILTLVLDHGGDVLAENDDGWNLLHQIGNYFADEAAEKARLLIERGLSVNHYSQFGGTPMHMAILNHQDLLLEVLLDCGADIEARAWSHRSPLHLAIELGAFREIEILLSRGAQLNNRDDRGWTPLKVAYFHNFDWQLQILIDLGATVYSKEGGEGYFNEQPVPLDCAKRLVKHIAKLKHSAFYVDEVDLQDLQQNCPKIFLLYEESLKELDKMTKRSFVKQLTYYDIVSKPEAELMRHARQHMFEEYVEGDICTEFPVYGSEIIKKLEIICTLEKEWRSIEIKISPCFSHRLPYLVIEKIACFTALLNKTQYICDSCVQEH